MKNSNIIVAFHIGRGGRYHNAGHKSFIGELNLNDILKRHDTNVFLRNRGDKGKFITPAYFDQVGTLLIEKSEADSGVGTIDWDGQYDTDTCMLLADCSADELKLIAADDENLVKQYFDDISCINVDWSQFNGNFNDLIDVYTTYQELTNVEDFYLQEEQDDKQNEDAQIDFVLNVETIIPEIKELIESLYAKANHQNDAAVLINHFKQYLPDSFIVGRGGSHVWISERNAGTRYAIILIGNK